MRGGDQLIEATRDEGHGGEIVGRKMGDGMDEDLYLLLDAF
jgi:hypothetical protein